MGNSNALNSCTRLVNDLLMSCWTSSRFKFKSTSGSDAGRGSVKASNPGKKFRILSPTFPALSSCEADSDLKTYKRIKSNIDLSVGRRFQFLKFPRRIGILFVPITFLLFCLFGEFAPKHLKFKFRIRHLRDLFLGISALTPQLRLYKANWCASCYLGFLIY